MTSRTQRFLIRCMVPLCGVACGGKEEPTTPVPAPVATVTLSPATATVAVGGTQAFTVTLKDANGTTLTGRPITWSSSAPAIAALSADGVATGVTPGTATITAECEGKTGSANLTVQKVASAVFINGGNNQVSPVGNRVAVSPSVKVVDTQGDGVRGVTVTFAIASGGGSLTGGVQTTDSAGVATLGSWTLGTTAGANSVTASVTGLAGPPVTFAASAIDVSSAHVPVSFCGDRPLWFAFQNDGGAWTSLTPDGAGVYNVAIVTRGAIAWVEQHPDGSFRTFVRYESRAELASEPCFRTVERPVKRVWGTYNGIGSDQTGTIAMGSVSIRGLPGGLNALMMRPWPMFELHIPDRPLDLIAAKYDGQGIPFRGSVNRNLDVANGGKVPPYPGRGAVTDPPDTVSVYFQAGIDPTIASLYSVAGVGGWNWQYSNDFYTPRSELSGFSSGSGAGSGVVGVTYFAMPTREVLPGDAYTFTFTAASGERERGFIHDLPHTFALTVTNRQMVLGPVLNSPTISTIATSPHVLMRAQVSAQPAYGATMNLIVRGATSLNESQVLVTAGYTGGTPSVWDIGMPDLTPYGFQSAWAIQPGEQSMWIIRGASERRVRGKNLTPLVFGTIRQP